MGNIGAAVSQEGYDVKDSADRLKVFSSSFQTLKIHSVTSKTAVVPSGEYDDPNVITLTHNLGYLAPFIIIYNGSTTIGTANSYVNSPSNLPYFFDVVDSYLTTAQYTDRLEISIPYAFDSEGGTAGGATVYFTIYQFVNDFTTVAGENIGSGTTAGLGSEDYGIRISKDGFDAKTCNDIDCILSSSFFNQIIHQVGVDTSGSATINISHNLGYIPSYLCFVKESSGNSHIRLFTGTKSTTTDIVIDNYYSYYAFYYIIFKQKND
jgi:hypothetical protein